MAEAEVGKTAAAHEIMIRHEATQPQAYPPRAPWNPSIDSPEGHQGDPSGARDAWMADQ
jgi:hypothetical protein